MFFYPSNFLRSPGQPGVRAHLVRGFPGAELLPEEPADERDSHRHSVPLSVLDGPWKPHHSQDSVRLPQVEWRFCQFPLTHCSSAEFRQIFTFTTGLVLNHHPYILYSVRLPFASLPFGVLENGCSNKACVSVLFLSSWAYFPHLPPAHVMQ